MAKTNHCIEEIREAAEKESFELDLNPADPDAVIKILLKVFNTVTDSRKKSMCKYSTRDILVSGMIAILCGANTWTAMASYVRSHAKQFIDNGVFCDSTPAHDTYGRVFKKVNGTQLQDAINAYMQQYIMAAHDYMVPEKETAEKVHKQLAIDGQYAKGSGRSNSSRNPTSPKGILHVQDNYLGITLGAIKVGPKTNEIPCAREFLMRKDLTDYITTFDALHTQKETLSAITDPKYREGKYKYSTGDYVVGVKENQPSLFEAINNSFPMSKIKELEQTEGKRYEEIDEKRKVIRRYYMLPAPCGKDEWPGLKSFVCCTVLKEGQIVDVRYYISSLDDIKLIADCIRKHWWVENKVHYILDVVYEQDANTTMDHDAIRSKGIMFTFADALIGMRNAVYNKNDSRKSFRAACDLNEGNTLLGECFLPFPKKIIFCIRGLVPSYFMLCGANVPGGGLVNQGQRCFRTSNALQLSARKCAISAI